MVQLDESGLYSLKISEVDRQRLMRGFVDIAQPEEDTDGLQKMTRQRMSSPCESKRATAGQRRLRSFLLLLLWQNVLVQASRDKDYMPGSENALDFYRQASSSSLCLCARCVLSDVAKGIQGSSSSRTSCTLRSFPSFLSTGDWWRRSLRLSLAGCDFSSENVLTMGMHLDKLV